MTAEQNVPGKDPEHTPAFKENGVDTLTEAPDNLGDATNSS